MWLPSFLTRAAFTLVMVLCTPVAHAEDMLVVVVGSTGAPMHLREPVSDVADGMAAALNAKGGLLGRHVRVAIEDDGCDARRAEHVAREVAAQHPAVIIGHSCAAAAVAASAHYRAAGLLLIATGVRHPALTPPRKADLVFRLAGRDDRQAAVIAATVKQQHAGNRMTIVRDQSQHGRQLALAIEREMVRAGDKPALVVAYTAGDKDHSAATSKIVASGSNVLVFTSQATEAAIIRGELRALGRRVHAIGSDIMGADHRLLATIGGEPPFVVMMPWPAWTSSRSDAPLTRAALEAWISAVRHAGSLDAARVGEALRDVPRATSLGPIRFDGNGDAEVPSHVPSRWIAEGWAPLMLSAE